MPPLERLSDQLTSNGPVRSRLRRTVVIIVEIISAVVTITIIAITAQDRPVSHAPQRIDSFVLNAVMNDCDALACPGFSHDRCVDLALAQPDPEALVSAFDGCMHRSCADRPACIRGE